MPSSISTFILATGLQAALKHVDKAGLVKRLADDLDKVSDANLQGQSERFQETMVKTLLLPLAKELLKENPDAYKRLLIAEAEPFREPIGGDKLISGELGEVPRPRQNFGPKL